jgi:hypothetical protein
LLTRSAAPAFYVAIPTSQVAASSGCLRFCMGRCPPSDGPVGRRRPCRGDAAGHPVLSSDIASGVPSISNVRFVLPNLEHRLTLVGRYRLVEGQLAMSSI